jgi:hypothetical protein
MFGFASTVFFGFSGSGFVCRTGSLSASSVRVSAGTFRFGICSTAFAYNNIAKLAKECAFNAKKLTMTSRAAKQTAKNIASAFV